MSPVSDYSTSHSHQPEMRTGTFQQSHPRPMFTPANPVEAWRQTVTQQAPSDITSALNRERDAAFTMISDQAGLQHIVADDQHAIDVRRLKGMLAAANKIRRSGEYSTQGASGIGSSLRNLLDPLLMVPSFANMMDQEETFGKLRRTLVSKHLGASGKGQLGERADKVVAILYDYYKDGLVRSNL